MDMKRIHSGKLRAIGYAAATRTLRVELEGGSAIDYENVDSETWRRFANSGVAWSFYRDNIEEEFHGKRGVAGPRDRPAALDALFGDGPAPDPASASLPPGLADLFKNTDQ